MVRERGLHVINCLVLTLEAFCVASFHKGSCLLEKKTQPPSILYKAHYAYFRSSLSMGMPKSSIFLLTSCLSVC